jgi:myosin heavy subunit
VRYTANSFVEKNIESLSNELKDLGLFSSISMVREIFSLSLQDEEIVGDNRRSTIRGISVASQFRLSLQDLVAELEQTQPHYIRCIKPNLNKAPNAFDGGEVLRQLRYAGMMEAIRIRREGYALREGHESFYSRFNVLLSTSEKKDGEGIQTLVRVLSKRLNLTISDCQIGHTKIFLRHELASKLERLLLLRNNCAARTLGRFGRFIAHRRAANLLTSWAKLTVHRLRKYYTRLAANRMIAFARMVHQRVKLTSKKNLVIKLQSLQRRRLATKYVKRLRDPFGHLTYAELNALHESECKRLDSAVASKDFKVAVELEQVM